MLFSSLVFLFIFLPVVLTIYYLLPRRLRNGFLLAVNLVFYGFGEPAFVLLMIFSILMNYAGGLMIARIRVDKKKMALAVTVCMNLLLLGIFKYAGFIGDTLRLLPPLKNIPVLHIPLPIGISFYTFQAISYLVDVYRRDCDAQKNPITFGMYISLFPQLIAGPIVRYSDISRSLADRHRESIEAFNSGAELFLIGLSKKVLLANPLGAFWAQISAMPDAIGTAGAWCGAIAFSMHLYLDFSGYSDMARGLGQMFGFTFGENFNYPYMSASATEFWRRWHISLTTWFRDYVYIPLGGNRRGKGRVLFNIVVVWALTGLWHGASWNFVCWGLYYAVLLVLEKIFLLKWLERLPSLLRRVYTLIIVAFGWVLFALEDAAQLKTYIITLLGGGNAIDGAAVAQIWGNLPLLLVAALACTPLAKFLYNHLPQKSGRALAGISCVFALLLCTAALVSDSYNPFLYFRF